MEEQHKCLEGLLECSRFTWLSGFDLQPSLQYNEDLASDSSPEDDVRDVFVSDITPVWGKGH